MNHALTLLGWNLCLSVPYRRHESPEGTVIADQAHVDVASGATLPSTQGYAADAGPHRVISVPVAGERGIHRWQGAIAGFVAASLIVTLAIWFAAIRQLQRVRRLLRSDSDDAISGSHLLHEISRRFQFRAAPKLHIVDAAISPMVWAEPGRPSVILSRQLADALDDEQLRYVIAHELAHYARCDHWSNVFGFFVVTLFWWHPVAWLARRELNLAAESCCDALVLEQFSGSRKPYAQTLLAVVDFVNAGKLLRPVLTMTFGGSSSLRRRIQMLANSGVRSHVSCGGWSLLVLGAVTLFLLPARAQEAQLAAQSKPAAKPEKCFVAGSVFDEETRQPIADAALLFRIDGERDPDKVTRRISTDSQGRYRLEVPMGNIQLWFPHIKPGYWIDPAISTTALATSAEKPLVTLDIPVKRGPAWPVRVTVENGIPENARLGVTVREVEDDVTRTKLINGEPVSFMERMNEAVSRLDKDGRGAFTQCGRSGKLSVIVYSVDSGLEVNGMTTEFLVDPAFEIAKVKTATPIAGTDKVELIDENRAKATIGNARVTIANGRPLLEFHLQRNKFSFQEFTGHIVDAAGQPIPDVRVGTAVEEIGAGGGEWPEVANTDREGRFCLRVRLLEFDRDFFLAFILNKDGYASFDSRNFPFPRKPVDPIDVGKFTMQAGQSLPIRVVDLRDRPLAGAVVEPLDDFALRRLSIRTDSEGRGVLRNLPAGRVKVRLSHADQWDEQFIILSRIDAENTETQLRIKPQADPPVANAKPPEPIAVGNAAPELVIAEWTDGKPRRLADYRGRVVVLDFWGTWCGASMRNIPVMQELADKYEPRGVVFLAIHTPDGVLDSVKKLKKVYAWKTATGIDRGTTNFDGVSSKFYGVRGYPAVIVIDVEGKIAYNSDIEPQDIDESMKEMQRLAESLQIPWPLSDEDDEESKSQMNRLNVALYGREIEKVIAPGRK